MRLPIQVECIVFKKDKEEIKFLLLERVASDGGFWQPITGGYEEEDISLLDCCYRELEEEIKISKEEVVKCIENIYFFQFGADVVMSEYVYAFEVSSNLEKIEISDEHDEYLWLSFEEALKKLKWDNNKEAFRKLIALLTTKEYIS